MIKISEYKIEEIRKFISNYELKQLIRTLKKLKLFSIERGILNEIKNCEQFLVKNKLQYSSKDYTNKNEKFILAITNILNKLS